jgi:hypothetical protein
VGRKMIVAGLVFNKSRVLATCYDHDWSKGSGWVAFWFGLLR